MNRTGDQPEVERSPGDRLAWRVHLFAEHPGRSAGVVLLLAAFIFVLVLSRDWILAGLAVFLFVTSLASFFFPTHYELTPEGPSRRILLFRTRKRWTDFRNYFWDQEGVRLSAFTFRSRLEPYRGLWLRFNGNRDEVLAYLSRYLARPAEAAAGREGSRT